MNFDPISITTYWAGASGLDGGDSDASDDNWQIVASGAYKAENMDGRLTFGYEKKPNDLTSADEPESVDLFLVMGELNMSFDMVSFFVIAGKNFGEVKSDDNAEDRDFKGYMVDAGVNFALDMATIRARAFLASGDDEGDFEDDFQVMSGATMSWAEIISDGYSYDRNASLAQIGGANKPSNMFAINLGADFKPTDTTTIKLDVYYIGMMEDRTVNGEDEDEIGTEIDLRLTQKIYDTLSMTVVGAYMLAEDGYGVAGAGTGNSGDDAFHLGLGLDFKF